MTRVWSVALAGVLLAALFVPGSANANAGTVLEAEDERGDVRIFAGDGPHARQRRSVDIRAVTIAPVAIDEPSVRFTVRLKHLTRSPDFVQRLDVLIRDGDPESPDVSADLIMIVRKRHGTGYVSVDDADGANEIICRLDRPKLFRARAIVRFDVPIDCVPPGPLRVRIKASTVPPDGGPEGAYSTDGVRMPGTHDLGGTAGDES